MDVRALIEALSRPGAWPGDGPVEVRQTHISVVFLTADRAYKIKKPLALGFLDYSTLALRRWYCEEEVRLDRRFAPGVYLGVVPIGMRDGRLVVGEEPAVEWAVEMVRLPDEATLLAHVEAGTVDRATMEGVGRAIAAFHARAERGPEISLQASLDVVAANSRENFEQTATHVGRLVDREVWERLRALTERELDRLGGVIAARAPLARDTHGDLRLEHIYLLDAVTCIDGIEFSERFRFADPASDTAFLVMDLGVRGEHVLAESLAEAWLAASGDAGAREVLPFYVAYRSIVRAKVAGMMALEPEVSPERRAVAAARARRHWLYALGVLEQTLARPLLVAVGGLPGTGKSTVARGLQGFEVIRADVVRKELAGLPTEASAASGYEQGLYAPAFKDQVYATCIERAREVVLRGGRAILDASWSKEPWRAALLDAGRALAIPVRFLWCEAPPDVVRSRLASRGPDASDADWDVYRIARDRWEPPGPAVAAVSDALDTSGPLDEVLDQARRLLS